MVDAFEIADDAHGFGEFFWFFVGAVDGGQRLEHIGDRHHAGGDGHGAGEQAFGVAGAVHFFVVAAGIFRHALQVARPGHRL